MSELQGPRIPGEEGSRRRRPIGWIIAGLVALLLLALLIPFACQTLTGGSDPQGGASGSQEDTTAQDSGGGNDASGDKNGGVAGGESTNGEGEVATADENTGPQNESETDGAASDGAGSGEESSGERAGDERVGAPLPETGGMSPAVLLALGTSLVAVAGGLSAFARRQNPSRG
jgi:LPXTG-motif cell wall-anchored protein